MSQIPSSDLFAAKRRRLPLRMRDQSVDIGFDFNLQTFHLQLQLQLQLHSISSAVAPSEDYTPCSTTLYHMPTGKTPPKGVQEWIPDIGESPLTSKTQLNRHLTM